MTDLASKRYEIESIENHTLMQFQSDFLEDGYKSACSCGWKSDRYPTMGEAGDAHAEHVRTAQKP